MWDIPISRQGETPLARQIYTALRTRILAGRLPPGEALPSTRELAVHLGVSRNTVNEAYDMLLAEGFILTRQGAPTRVAEGLQLEPEPPPPQTRPDPPAPAYAADFRTGLPDLDSFPRPLWNRLLHQAAAELPATQLAYSGPQGLPGLRRAIAAWLARSRGLEVDPQAVFVTAGATHALHVLAQLLCGQERPLWIEDPCHTGMLHVLQARGCPVQPVPVDEYGLQTAVIPGEGAGAVYVTPSHQFPLGGILPAGRRAALVRLARQRQTYIIEDDYDSEFRYSGAPVAPLAALDHQRVAYVGTFSKILFPALRVGYVVLPEALHAAWRDLRTHTDVQNPPFEQAALAEMIRTGQLDRHVQRMRRLYRRRRAALLDALAENFGEDWRPWGDAAGLHLAVQFPGRAFDAGFVARSRRAGLRAVPVAHYCITQDRHVDKLLLGYGHLSVEQIRSGVRLLRAVIAGG
jgi:GntR family transcriptional regulator/MocR family aminotransferase